MPRFLYVSILPQDTDRDQYTNVLGEFRYDYMNCPTYRALQRADVRHARCHMETTILCPGKGVQSYQKDGDSFPELIRLPKMAQRMACDTRCNASHSRV